jgi:hypothetical protein
MKRIATQGMAIVSVLFIMTGVLILAIVFTSVTMSERSSAGTTTTVNENLLAADSLSERARITLLNTYNGGNYSIGNFLTTLQTQHEGGTVTFSNLQGTKTGTVDGVEGRWTIRDVQTVDNSGWVEVAATAETATGSQTVIRRIGFGDPDIFQLAMLTETVNCMFCHLQVNGDVGALDYLRPGWGTEVDSSLHGSGCWTGGANDDKCDFGWGSGGANGGSKVDGNVFAAQGITDDDTVLTGANKKINGTEVTGNIEVNSRSNKLPKDQNNDGIPDFPEIRREKARASAKGKVSNAATMIGVPLNGTYTGNYSSSNISGVDKTYNGNLILVGTASNPIDLSGDIFVEGDIIIKGVVKGIGAIYSGRNIYFAGDVTLTNPPSPVNEGICSGITDPDACAKKNIEAGKDVLRTGARGNIVIGDYTEFDSNNNWKPWSQRQSSDFYRSQFQFQDGWDDVNKVSVPRPKFYDTRNGDELELVNGKFINADRTVVSESNVEEVDAWESYDYSLRPGAVQNDGSFNTWMSDGKYQELLGTETFDYNTWRTPVDKNDESAFRDTFSKAFQDMGLTLKGDTSQNVETCTGTGRKRRCTTTSVVTTGTITEVWNQRNTANAEVELKDANNNSIGRVQWDGGNTIRVIVSANAKYETQINNIDAFLYANQRIAGKTSMQAMAVEGGMIAREIGVLAPGRRIEWPFGDNYSQINENLCSQAPTSSTPNQYYVKGSTKCALTLNYDYRLRNGGYGFNLVNGEIGKTLSWRVAESSSEKVSQ